MKWVVSVRLGSAMVEVWCKALVGLKGAQTMLCRRGVEVKRWWYYEVEIHVTITKGKI